MFITGIKRNQERIFGKNIFIPPVGDKTRHNSRRKSQPLHPWNCWHATFIRFLELPTAPEGVIIVSDKTANAQAWQKEPPANAVAGGSCILCSYARLGLMSLHEERKQQVKPLANVVCRYTGHDCLPKPPLQEHGNPPFRCQKFGMEQHKYYIMLSPPHEEGFLEPSVNAHYVPARCGGNVINTPKSESPPPWMND